MKEYVRTILDYPVKGVQFRDITTLLQNSDHFKKVIDDMMEKNQPTFPISILLTTLIAFVVIFLFP